MRSLTSRIVASVLAIMIVLAAFTSWITVRTAWAFHDELHQRLNASIAMYIDEEGPLLRDGLVDQSRLAELARRAMVINPIAEVYLVDVTGRVVGHPPAAGNPGVGTVDLAPLRQFLADRSSGPIYGTNPRVPDEQTIFSAAPIETDGHLDGYVYVVLGGERLDGIAATLAGSYVLRSAVLTVVAIVLLAGVVAWAAASWLMRPLRDLHARVESVATELGTGSTGEDRQRAPSDIADLRAAFDAMARQLRRHVDSLRELDRSRRELVATVSHDLRTPLTSMRGYLETLQIADGCMPAARRKHFTEIALRHCDRLERLVDQLLTLARVDGPLVRLNLEPLSAAELVQDIVTKLQLRAESAAIRLAMEVDTSIPRIVADIGMIECVLENLADNALRHTPRGGSVVIRAYAEHDSAWIEVQDTGCGVPPSDLARLRRPLETGPGGHVGLGLSIVERVLRLHGSCLELSSKPGHGTLARFGLAVASARDFSTFADPSWAREDLVNS